MKLRRRQRNEKGLVIVLMAISLGVMVLICGFSVDLGSWYLTGAKQQRAADTASLAGVAWMPDLDTATKVALETAKTNGYDDASPTIQVIVTSPADLELTVTIIDNNVKTYFTSQFLKKLKFTRDATATQMPGVHLGSPNNAFGFGDLASSAGVTSPWAAISGYCNSSEQGDILASFRAGNIQKRGDPGTFCDATSDPAYVNPY